MPSRPDMVPKWATNEFYLYPGKEIGGTPPYYTKSDYNLLPGRWPDGFAPGPPPFGSPPDARFWNAYKSLLGLWFECGRELSDRWLFDSDGLTIRGGQLGGDPEGFFYGIPLLLSRGYGDWSGSDNLVDRSPPVDGVYLIKGRVRYTQDQDHVGLTLQLRKYDPNVTYPYNGQPYGVNTTGIENPENALYAAGEICEAEVSICAPFSGDEGFNLRLIQLAYDRNNGTNFELVSAELTVERLTVVSRPTDIPDFATNTNYSAGPLVGTPTKLLPNEGYTGDGFTLLETLPPLAQFENWRENLFCQWCDFINDITDYVVTDVGNASATSNYALTVAEAGYGGFTVASDEIEVPAAGSYEVSYGIYGLLSVATSAPSLEVRVGGAKLQELGPPALSSSNYLAMSISGKIIINIATPASEKISLYNPLADSVLIGLGQGFLSIRRIG